LKTICGPLELGPQESEEEVKEVKEVKEVQVFGATISGFGDVFESEIFIKF